MQRGEGGGGWLDLLSELSHICIQFYTASNKWSKGLGKDLSAHVHVCECERQGVGILHTVDTRGVGGVRGQLQ